MKKPSFCVFLKSIRQIYTIAAACKAPGIILSVVLLGWDWCGEIPMPSQRRTSSKKSGFRGFPFARRLGGSSVQACLQDSLKDKGGTNHTHNHIGIAIVVVGSR